MFFRIQYLPGCTTPSPQYHLEHFVTPPKSQWLSLLLFPTTRALSSALNNHAHRLWVCLFWTLPINETTARPFCAPSLSLSLLLSVSGLWHVLRFHCYIISHWMDTPCVPHPSVMGIAVTSHPAVNIDVHVFVWRCF